MRSKDSTSSEPKKITIFSNLNISTAYSISAKEFKWSPVRMSTALNFFDNKLATNLNATFDPYGLDEKPNSCKYTQYKKWRRTVETYKCKHEYEF